MQPQLLASSTRQHPGLGGGHRPEAAVSAIVVGSHIEEGFSRWWILGIVMPLCAGSGRRRLNAGTRAEVDEGTGLPQTADAPANHAVGKSSGDGVPSQPRSGGSILD